MRRAFAILLLGLVLACGGGGGGSTPSSSQGVGAPTNLHTLNGPTANDFILAWNPPSGVFDGYNLEVQAGSASFQQMNSGLIDPTYTAIQFNFTDAAPEDTTFTFRMNAVKGAQTSPYSNTAAVISGLHAPGQPTGQYDWNQGGVALTWIRNSTASTGFLVERMQTDANGYSSGTWTALPVADPSVSSYLDTSVTLANYYTYRVTNQKGSESSLAGGSSNPIYAGLATPGQPTATFDFNGGGMNVAWTRNTTFNDGVKLERAETTSYGSQTGPWTQLVVGDPLASTFLDTTVVANTSYSYRVTNLRGGVSSLPSTPSYPAYAGLAPPSFLTATWDSVNNCVSLYWSGNSVYGSISLERVTCDAAGQAVGNWGILASLTGSSTGYTDLATQEGTSYLYRISGTRGSYTSLTVSSYPLTTPLKAPVGLTVVPATGGLKLTWQNRSTAASQIVVRRNPGIASSNDIAILSPGTTSYTDPLTSLGYYTYNVVAKIGYLEAYSQPVTAATANPPGSLSLTSTTLYSVSNILDAALRPAGTWAVISATPFGVLSNGAPWPAYFPGNFSRAAHPVVQVDKQGWPHAIYAMQSATVAGEVALIHIWYDGGGWRTETLISKKIPWTSADSGWTYRLDSTGMPHLLLNLVTPDEPYGGTTANLSYFHKAGGTWVEESLANLTPSISNVGTYHIVLDDSDVPHVLLGNWSSVIDYVRTGPGVWTSTVLPTGTVNAGWYDYLDAFWIDGSNGWVFYENSAGGSGQAHSLCVIQMKAGTWQAPVLLGGRDSDGASTTATAALSPDRTRTAILYNTSAGIKCYHQAADGWHETLVAPNSSNYPFFWLGFDANQKAHLLLWTITTWNLTEFHE